MEFTKSSICSMPSAMKAILYLRPCQFLVESVEFVPRVFPWVLRSGCPAALSAVALPGNLAGSVFEVFLAEVFREDHAGHAVDQRFTEFSRPSQLRQTEHLRLHGHMQVFPPLKLLGVF